MFASLRVLAFSSKQQQRQILVRAGRSWLAGRVGGASDRLAPARTRILRFFVEDTQPNQTKSVSKHTDCTQTARVAFFWDFLTRPQSQLKKKSQKRQPPTRSVGGRAALDFLICFRHFDRKQMPKIKSGATRKPYIFFRHLETSMFLRVEESRVAVRLRIVTGADRQWGELEQLRRDAYIIRTLRLSAYRQLFCELVQYAGPSPSPIP